MALKRQITFFSFVFVVQLISLVGLFVTPWILASQVPLPSTLSWSWLKFMSIQSVMLSNHLILCCPHLILPSIFATIRVFSYELALCIKWPKCWSFNFSNSLSNEYSGLISFRIDWLDLLAVQGILKSLLSTSQFKSINSLVLNFLYSSNITSIHDSWKNHSFD